MFFNLNVLLILADNKLFWSDAWKETCIPISTPRRFDVVTALKRRRVLTGIWPHS